MRLSHDPMRTGASFDDPNLVSRAGLVPVTSLAERAGLEALVRRHVQIAAPCGVLNRPGLRGGFSICVQPPDRTGHERSRRLRTRLTERPRWRCATAGC
jgi:hypothetical protein